MIFFTKREIQHLFLTRSMFEKYIEVDDSYRKLTKFSIPDNKRWDKLLELIECNRMKNSSDQKVEKQEYIEK